MDCNTFEKMIPDFLSDRLDNETAREFLSHYESCSSCREELSIQYLVYAGLPKLETGETFNLQRDLDECIEEAGDRNHRRRRLSNIAYTYETITILLSAAAVVVLLSWIL